MGKWVEHTLVMNPRVDIDRTDRIARVICTEACEAQGKEPCWLATTDRPDAMEWPNPFCERPNCHDVARAVVKELTWQRSRRAR